MPSKPGKLSTGPLVALIGGFFDSWTYGVAKNAEKHLPAYFGAVETKYFAWDNGGDAAEWVKKERRASLRHVALVGHSYGGDTAMGVAGDLENVPVALVVTLDPTSRFQTDRPRNVGKWVNVYVVGVNDFSDVVSGVGGNWGYCADADVNIAVVASAAEKQAREGKKKGGEAVVVDPDASHASVVRMLNAANRLGHFDRPFPIQTDAPKGAREKIARTA